ncbi:MAG: prepilin peptidase [Nanoarchaeota archaeon]
MIIFAWLLIGIGVAGFGLAAYLDLKTTEFPEWLPYGMIILSLIIHGIAAFILTDVWIFLSSLLIGSAFLGLGLLLYLTKQWGDGDSWLLGVMGFMFPVGEWFYTASTQIIFPFHLMLLMNFFLISFGYLIVYSLVMGLRSPKQTRIFLRELKGQTKILLLFFVASATISIAFSYYAFSFFAVPLARMIPILSMPLFVVFLIAFFRYGRFVEKNLFKKRINVKDLRVGDVLTKARWKGLTEKEVKQIKTRGGTVVVKDGVRFAPVFLITLIVTLLFGNVMLLFI